MEHKFNYEWTLTNANFTKDKGTVFSCFACGGGSTMGYKLAGFDVIGCNEIDPRMNKLYVANHHPKYNYVCDIREMVEKAKRHDLPKELYQLDVLDGSPPCSSFSLAGVRERDWGKSKVFREGQAEQVLDTLFFDFIDLAEQLKPKVVIGENVKGMLIGKAKAYVDKIVEEFDKIGYHITVKLLNASYMGVPQRRERVFFIAVRKDMMPAVPVDLDFNESQIEYWEFADNEGDEYFGKARELWENRCDSDRGMREANMRLYGKDGFYTHSYAKYCDVVPTLTAHRDSIRPYHKPKYLSDREIRLISSFPLDYNFCDGQAAYVCGMSVPPIMMAQVASRVYDGVLSKIELF